MYFDGELSGNMPQIAQISIFNGNFPWAVRNGAPISLSEDGANNVLAVKRRDEQTRQLFRSPCPTFSALGPFTPTRSISGSISFGNTLFQRALIKISASISFKYLTSRKNLYELCDKQHPQLLGRRVPFAGCSCFSTSSPTEM